MESAEKLSGIEQIEQMEQEVMTWLDFLNNKFGLLCFTLALTCFLARQSLEISLVSTISLIVAFIYAIYNQKTLGKMTTVMSVRRQRDILKNNGGPEFQELDKKCKLVNNNFLSLRNAPVFLIGMLSLMLCVLWDLGILTALKHTFF